MIEQYNLDEIFKIAEQIEISGENFYRKAAEQYPDYGEFLLKLAEEEVSHRKIFHQYRENLKVSDSGLSVSDPEGYLEGYLKAIANNLVFGDPIRVLAGCKSIQEVFSFAMGREKDTILFYSGVKRVLTNEADQNAVELLILEEMRHVFWLEEQEVRP